MRSKSLVLLALALGCGLVASIGITRALEQPTQQVTVGETREIFVALIEIKTGDPITPQNVKLDPWPIDKIPEGAIADLNELEGRRAKQKLYPGEPLIPNKLLGKDDKEDVLADLPPGMRAVTVKVDAVSGGAGLLKPGDKVDVIVHVNSNPGAGIPTAVTIAPKDLRNLKVFAIDSVTTRGNDGEQTVVARTISLVVTPIQAKLVTLSQNLGEIRLVGRNAKDVQNEDDNETTVTFDSLVNGVGGAPLPSGGLLETIQKQLEAPKPTTKTPVESEPVAKTEPVVNREVMVIRDGAQMRETLFENGKPILTDPATAPPVESESKPMPENDASESESAPENPPPARPNPLRMK